MNRRNPRLRELDRQLNRALRDAHGPAQIFAIKSEFADKRRRLLTGQDLPERIANPPVSIQTIRWTMPEVQVDAEARMNEAVSRVAVDWGGRNRGEYTITFLTANNEESEERKAAKQRAEEFLLAHLTDEQKETYFKFQHFIVENKTSKRLWRIRTNTTAFNVDAIDRNGKRTATFCGVSSGSWIPPCDIYLAQKMLLETDETEFLIKANRQSQSGFYIQATPFA